MQLPGEPGIEGLAGTIVALAAGLRFGLPREQQEHGQGQEE